jgi:Ca-activated chloride channel family protein
VRVRQEFENSLTEPIEAIYTFPLSQNGAVDDMTMTIGTRVVRGKIMKREEAREVYEQAKTEGKGSQPSRSGATEHFYSVGREHHAR